MDEPQRAGKLSMGATDEVPVGIGGALYDWRQDRVAAARTLAAQVDAAVAARVKGGGPARVNLIGRSMGALVVRWSLLYGTADLPADGSPRRSPGLGPNTCATSSSSGRPTPAA